MTLLLRHLSTGWGLHIDYDTLADETTLLLLFLRLLLLLGQWFIFNDAYLHHISDNPGAVEVKAH